MDNVLASQHQDQKNTPPPAPMSDIHQTKGGPASGPEADQGSRQRSSGSNLIRSPADLALNSAVPPADRPTQLAISYLPYSLKEEEFLAIFEQFGLVEGVKIVRDSSSQRSRGFGFVCYSRHEDASVALSRLQDFPLYQRRIRIAWAEPQRTLQQCLGTDGVIPANSTAILGPLPTTVVNTANQNGDGNTTTLPAAEPNSNSLGN